MSLNVSVRRSDEEPVGESVPDKFYMTNFEFVDTLGLTPEMFSKSAGLDRVAMYGQCTDNETNFLFNFVRKIKPKKVLEFSPSHGYSTANICMALLVEDVDFDYIETYELDTRAFSSAKNHFKNLSIDQHISLKWGDVLTTLDEEKLKECDLLFVDSDHHKEFCQKYVDKYFDMIPKGAWVGIHDISFTPVMNGETEVVVDWMKSRGIENYFYIPDVLKRMGVNDNCVNALNPANRETSITLWFQR
jgi:predicted O-methyltransferase YrrM